MDKKELIEKLKRISRYEDGAIDQEDTHIQADKALLEFINDLEVTEAFNKIDKWYA